VADVSQFHRDSTLAVLLRLNLILTYHRPLDQAELLGKWLPDLAERFLAVMREWKATVVFHEHQVRQLLASGTALSGSSVQISARARRLGPSANRHSSRVAVSPDRASYETLRHDPR
jgi:hypothetical protein